MQVVDAPKTAAALLKSRICGKDAFPYGDSQYVSFYNPRCIDQIYTCKDLCGNKCIGDCTYPHDGCARGKLTNNFLFCPMEPIDQQQHTEIPYVTYELVEAKDIKEGKQAYKRTEKVLTDMLIEDFVDKFVTDFDEYAKHVVESWFLNTVKNVAFSSHNQPSHALIGVSDFAQNIQVEKKFEMSEEHFHKAQISMFATVASVSSPDEGGECIKHSITQVTTSDNK